MIDRREARAAHGRAVEARRLAQYREDREAGRCVRCGRAVLDGAARCPDCREAANERSRQRRNERRAARACVDCGAPAGDKARCPACRANRAGRSEEARAELIAALIARDGPNCAWCGQPLGADEPVTKGRRAPGRTLAIDHRHPTAKGGADDFDNLQVLHDFCNSQKAGHPLAASPVTGKGRGEP